MSVEEQGKALLKESEAGNFAAVNALVQVSHPCNLYIQLSMCVYVRVCARACGERVAQGGNHS